MIGAWTLLLLATSADGVSLRASLARVVGQQRRQAPAAAETSAVEEEVTEGSEEAATCTCDECEGRRVIEAGIGAWSCGMKSEPEGDLAAVAVTPQPAPTCEQVGDQADWVIAATSVSYDRYCTFSCKPDVPEALTSHVNCTALAKDIVHKYAQTPDGNGRAFVWKSIPLVDSLTLADIPSKVGELHYAMADHTTGRLRQIFGKSARRRRTEAKVLEYLGEVPGCHCRCGTLNATIGNVTLPTLQEQVAGVVGDYNEKWSLLELDCPSCPDC